MKKLISLLVMLAHLMLLAAPTVAYARDTCVFKESVCVDGPSTKVINGVPVTKDCWEYQDKYECLEPDPADFCAPLKQPASKCEVTGQSCLETKDGECLRYTHQYSCDVNIKTLNNNALPKNIQELKHEHLITSDWDSSKCDALGKNCKVVATKCLEGPATKVINGVEVTKDCWQEERTMQCATGEDSNECAAISADPACKLKSEQCVHSLPDGSCQINEKTFTCTESSATTQEVSACVDRDFASTMTAMEMSREMQRFYDPNNQKFFNGEANKCSIKLGGALDGVLGGDCCKTDADPSSMRDAVLQMGVQKAAQYAISTIASHYTYTTLTGQAASYMATAMSSAGVTGVAATGSGVTGGIGAFGFTVGPAASGTGLTVAFDPVSFGIAIAIMALQQYLKCGQEEVLTAMKRKADLCHYVGSYCGQKALGGCIKKVESQCCYVSKLTKIVNVGGKEQLDMDFGTPEAPTCEGFTAQEMEQLDFSKLDLSEFYKEIYANMENVAKQAGNAAQGAATNIDKGTNAPVKNYYE